MSDETKTDAWHTVAVDEALSRGASSANGLTSSEAGRRLDAEGPNELAMSDAASPWRTLFEQFKNVLIVILLAATALSGVLGHALEAAVIAVIVLAAVFLGFIQEYRASRALEALARMAAPAAWVLRDGIESSIASRDVVRGDVIVLHAGDRVPADARMIFAAELRVDESALTGESLPVAKGVDALDIDDLPLAERRNMVYSGTLVTSGRGRAMVVATGTRTEFGKISRLVESVRPGRTPLQEDLDRLGSQLGKAALVVVALIVVVGILREQPLLDALLFGVALAVAVVPEALPAVVTISLALGVRRMVKRKALVRRLPVVETLGSTSVICSDKTGTLTRNEMTVRRIATPQGAFDVSGAGYSVQGDFTSGGRIVTPSLAVKELLKTAALASDARPNGGAEGDSSKHHAGDPTEIALVVAAGKAAIDVESLDAGCPRLEELGFTSERRRMTTLHRDGEGRRLVCSKGAVDVILSDCAQIFLDGRTAPIRDADRNAIIAEERAMASSGLRVLAFAMKLDGERESAERDMTWLGLVGMMDPPRAEVPAAIRTSRDAGMRIVMITGDHPLTATAVAREIGLLEDRRVVSGAELSKMSDADLARDVDSIGVYARVSPVDKLRVVEAWQGKGAVVAMTGDGVNDAPALRRADVGVAMGVTGTDVSKEAAAVTLLDDNFATIVAAVEEGRIVFANIRKYLTFLLSSNVGEILLMAGATLAGYPLPLSAVQILYVNLATDGLPALALAFDPPESDLMKRPPRDPRAGIFTRPLLIQLLAGGIWSAGINLILFAVLLSSGRPLQEAMATTFVSLVLIQFLKAYLYRSERRTVFEGTFTNVWLNLAVAWEIALLVAVVNVPVLADAFGATELVARDWSWAVAAAVTVVPVLEGVKALLRRGAR